VIQFPVIFVTWACHKEVALQCTRMELFALTMDVMCNAALGLCFLCFTVDMPLF